MSVNVSGVTRVLSHFAGYFVCSWRGWCKLSVKDGDAFFWQTNQWTTISSSPILF